MKIYDKINDEFLYKNKITGVITSKKPVFLGKEDLPEPKSYEAPLNYDPGHLYDKYRYANNKCMDKHKYIWSSPFNSPYHYTFCLGTLLEKKWK